jgi:hypothetical protein
MRRLAVGFIAIIVLLSGCKRPVPPTPTPVSTTAPTSAPTTAIAATLPQRPPVTTFGQLVKLYYPNSPSTQPLDTPVDLVQAARLTVPDPIYLDRLQNIWITRSDAEETPPVLADAWNQTEHLVRERPAYVHWRTEPTASNHAAHSTPVLFCPSRDGRSVQIVEETRSTLLTSKCSDYHWPNTVSFNDVVIVGTVDGASTFIRTGAGWEESCCAALSDAKQPHALTQFAMDADGVLAYVPPENGNMGSEKTARFADGKWSLLADAKQWPGHFLDLIPLTDGTVLQIIAQPPSPDEIANHKTPRVRLAMGILETQSPDTQLALELIKQLNDDNAKKRQEAFERLAVFGASLWPILEQQMPRQPDAVQEKLQLLLKNKTQPTLGEMEPVDYRLELVARSTGGGALFFDKAGVSVINADGDPTLVAPAWISAVPGQPIHLLIGDAWADIIPREQRVIPMGDSDWLLWDEETGPHEIVGSLNFAAILKPEELQFSEFVGVDRNGRWLFHDPAEHGGTLILDPTLLPVTPQLPVWKFTVPDQGVAGWDQQNWPAYRDTNGNIWMINEDGFHLEDQKTAHFHNTAADIPRAISPGTQPTTAESQPPLWVDADGTQYFGGITDVWRVKHGVKIRCPLPLDAKGTMDRPWLMKDKAGHLYLLNQPGQIVRLGGTFQSGQPLKIEATFTQNIPNSTPLRVWIDPADRIVILYDDNQLAIGFCQGVMPAAILDKIAMPPKGQQ